MKGLQGLDVILNQARELGDEGDFAGMAERLREELENYPDDPALLCWLGIAERELGLVGSQAAVFRTKAHCLQVCAQGPIAVGAG